MKCVVLGFIVLMIVFVSVSSMKIFVLIVVFGILWWFDIWNVCFRIWLCSLGVSKVFSVFSME